MVIAAFVASSILAVVYILTLAPTISFGDSPEYVTAAHSLGIPHPPSNPLFIMLGHVAGLGATQTNYASRLALLNAATGALAAALWCAIAFRWVHHITQNAQQSAVAAVSATLTSGLMFSVWHAANTSQKPYLLANLLGAALILIATNARLRALDDPRADARDILMICYIAALGVAVHPMSWLGLVPALILLRPALMRVRSPGALLAGVVLVSVVGLSSTAVFLPLRALQDPAINIGDPRDLESLLATLNRTMYGHRSIWNRQVPLGHQFSDFLAYWRMQSAASKALASVLIGTISCLYGVGLLTVVARAKKLRWGAMTLAIVTTVALVVYLNLKAAPAFASPGIPREAADRDYYFIVTYMAVAPFVAIGLALLFEARWFGRLTRDVALVTGCALPLGLAVTNWRAVDRGLERGARELGLQMLRELPPGAILFTVGDNYTFPLWYLTEVEAIRTDVSIVSTVFLNAPWYRRQMVAGGLADSATMANAMEEARLQRERSRLHEGQKRDKVPVRSLSSPTDFNASLGLLRSHVEVYQSDYAILALITASGWRRPICFGEPYGLRPDSLYGLGEYIVSTGWTRCLRREGVGYQRVAYDSELGYFSRAEMGAFVRVLEQLANHQELPAEVKARIARLRAKLAAMELGA